MAVIETYSAQIPLQTSRIQQSRVAPEQVMGGIDIVGIGKTVTGFLAEQNQKQKQSDKLELGKTMSQFHLDSEKRLEELSTQHGDKPEFEEIVLKDFDDRLSQVKHSPLVKDEFDLDAQQLRASLQKDAFKYKVNYEREKAISSWQDMTTINTNIVARDPSKLNYVLSRQVESIKDMNLPPDAKNKLIDEASDKIIFAHAQGVAEKTPSVFVNSYNQGKFDNVPNAARLLEVAETNIKRIQAEGTIGSKIMESNFELEIVKSDSPNALNTILSEVDKVEPAIGVIKANDLRIKIEQKMKSIREDYSSVERGKVFFSGEYSINRENQTEVKDFNNAYRMFETSLQDQDISKANTVRADIISKARYVPEDVKGLVESYGRSVKEEQINAVSDLIERVRAKNPNLVKDLGSEDTINRITMIRNLLDSNMTTTEAVKSVDEQLRSITPEKKRMLSQQVNAEFTDTNYFKDNVDNIFNRWFAIDSLSGERENIAAVQADYAAIYKANFMVTGDKNAAAKMAETLIRSDYGESSINDPNVSTYTQIGPLDLGFPDKKNLMKYPPERYFATSLPEGVRSAALRKQLNGAVKFLQDKMDLSIQGEEQVSLDIDPIITKETVRAGKPLYRLSKKNEFGIPVNVLPEGLFITFDDKKLSRNYLKSEVSLKKLSDGPVKYVTPIVRPLAVSGMSEDAFEIVKYKDGKTEVVNGN